MSSGRSKAFSLVLGLQLLADLLVVLVAATEDGHVPLLWIALILVGVIQGILLLVVWKIASNTAESSVRRKVVASLILGVPPMIAAVVVSLLAF